MSEQIKPSFTVKQVLDLASLCHQFLHYPVINDCYWILFEAAMEQATPGAIAAERAAQVSGESYFPEFIDC